MEALATEQDRIIADLKGRNVVFRDALKEIVALGVKYPEGNYRYADSHVRIARKALDAGFSA